MSPFDGTPREVFDEGYTLGREEGYEEGYSKGYETALMGSAPTSEESILRMAAEIEAMSKVIVELASQMREMTNCISALGEQFC